MTCETRTHSSLCGLRSYEPTHNVRISSSSIMPLPCSALVKPGNNTVIRYRGLDFRGKVES